MTPRAALSTTVFGLSALGVAAYLVVTAALVALVVWQSNRNFAAEVLDTLSAEAETIIAMAGDRSSQAINAGLQRLHTRDQHHHPNRLYFLSGPDGRKLAGNLAQPPVGWSGKTTGGLFSYKTNGAPSLRTAAGLPLALDDGGFLVIARDIEDQRKFVNRVRWIALLAIAAIAMGGLSLGFLASRRVLSRVEKLTTATQSIMAGNLSGRLPVQNSGDEFDRLSDSVNAMLERIEQLMGGMKEVSDNIAHDLKTPLNRLRNRAENALRTARTKDELSAGLGQTIEAADEIIKTFNALLLIARLEAGAIEETKAPVALGSLVAGAAELYEPLAEEAGLRMQIGHLPEVTIMANQQLIIQAVINLIDNSIKYGSKHSAVLAAAPDADPPHHAVHPGQITVDLVKHAHSVDIVIADNGPGISEHDRQRVLDRFVRLDKSRSLPGTGLGLSLVSAVARLHGGTLRLEDNAPGLRAVLRLPI